MTINPILKIIRAKKFGVLMRDARLKTGKSLEECAQAMGISGDELTAIEYGERPPTLPEIEILAYYLEIPLDHFWGNAVLEGEDRATSFDAGEIKQIRQTAIGSIIRKARLEASLSQEELAQRLGITPDVLESYEGVVPIPVQELEIIAQV
jgi:transcriptional regulator with XRE-family HTH domain